MTGTDATAGGRTEIRVAGFGGQGVILAGMIIGRAASIFENRSATLVQSFGPEARGGSCSAQVVIADDVIAYPYVEQPDILVVMSEEASRIFSPKVRPGGLILFEKDLVDETRLPAGVRRAGVPATRIAEHMKRRMILNIVMVGFFASATSVVGRQAAEAAVKASVPTGTESLNLRAFEAGYAHGMETASGEVKP